MKALTFLSLGLSFRRTVVLMAMAPLEARRLRHTMAEDSGEGTAWQLVWLSAHLRGHTARHNATSDSAF